MPGQDQRVESPGQSPCHWVRAGTGPPSALGLIHLFGFMYRIFGK